MYFLDVPYYSQYQNVLEPKWHSRACGVTCAKMIIKYFYPDNDESIDAIIDEGVKIGGYGENGWDHEALVRIFRNRGIFSYREEFKSQLVSFGKNSGTPSTYDAKMAKAGIKKISNMLKAGRPVVVSVAAGFDENKCSHLIVITGFDEGDDGEISGFMYNDPYTQRGIKKNLFVATPKFEEFWRRLCIFVS
jgi:uncharacterized protein YvpB